MVVRSTRKLEGGKFLVVVRSTRKLAGGKYLMALRSTRELADGKCLMVVRSTRELADGCEECMGTCQWKVGVNWPQGKTSVTGSHQLSQTES